jgi:protein-tyrosine kinase
MRVQLPDDHLVSLLHPDNWEAEPYRTLRHAVERLSGTGRAPVLAISSAAPGDGKTTTTLNLAAALAEPTRAQVLVIDADLRRCALAAQLGLGADQGPGLAGVIQDDSLLLGNATRSSGRWRFSVVPAGRRPASPYQVLDSSRMGAVLADARQRYDFILIDTPPFIPFADCRVLSRWVDGFILVIGAHRTPRRLVEEALNAVEPSKLWGLVFNGDDGPLWGSNRYYQYTMLEPYLPEAGEPLPKRGARAQASGMVAAEPGGRAARRE